MPHYRHITVDGKDYEWVANYNTLAVKGVGSIDKEMIGESITPRDVAAFIRGEFKPRTPKGEANLLDKEFMDGEDFVSRAFEILELTIQLDRLQPKHPNSTIMVYDDPFMQISPEDGDCHLLEVFRKPLTDLADHFVEGAEHSGLRVSNPGTITNGLGHVIRHHSEHCYLVQHMKRVEQRLTMICNAKIAREARGLKEVNRDNGVSWIIPAHDDVLAMIDANQMPVYTVRRMSGISIGDPGLAELHVAGPMVKRFNGSLIDPISGAGMLAIRIVDHDSMIVLKDRDGDMLYP